MRKINAGCRYVNWPLIYITAFLTAGLTVMSNRTVAMQDKFPVAYKSKRSSLGMLFNITVTLQPRQREKQIAIAFITINISGASRFSPGLYAAHGRDNALIVGVSFTPDDFYAKNI